MSHWLSTAISTYLLHPMHGNGYSWWSGPGSDLGELTLLAAVVTLLKHRNCVQPGCWRLGHPHPVHHTPVCRKHFYSGDTAPKPPVD